MTNQFQAMAAIRYGFGLSPLDEPPASVQDMLNRLSGPDEAAQRWPIAGFDQRARETFALQDLRRKERKKGKTDVTEVKKLYHALARGLMKDVGASVQRAIGGDDAFRERLVRFWADHFTVVAKGKGLRFVTTAYVEEAIRPHVTGRFSDLLKSADTHPAMLVYLDQILSIGPHSPIGKRSGRGLNENLAREIMELHTLGVGASYTQKDVRQFAELLTGLFYNFRTGSKFRAAAAEPGAETVLGRSYGGGKASVADIHAALDDLARHPDTARHIARKLAVHFVSDSPDQGLVDHVAAAFRDSDGDLMAVYTALLEHPAAWANPGEKARQPFDYVVAALRALAVPPAYIGRLKPVDIRRWLFAPMAVMGQPWQQPNGPDGWPEETDYWITPSGLAARIEWALMVADKLGRRTDPRELARRALAGGADARMLQVVGAAESRREGIALVLASPEFNRR